jgi:hypothetical protein
MTIEHSVDFPHIVCNPRVQGGEPTVAGTRVPVRAIVVAHRFNPRVAYLCEAVSVKPPVVQGAEPTPIVRLGAGAAIPCHGR